MVGSGIKKFAKENNFKVTQGVAAGKYRNFLLTLSEGSGWKMVIFGLTEEREEILNNILEWLNDSVNQKEYRITDFDVTTSFIRIVFHDNPGTMKKMTDTIDIICDRLNSAGVYASEKCVHCKMPVEPSATPVLVNSAAFLMHDSCIEQFNAETENVMQEKKVNGNYIGGIFGALIGALIGSVPWIIASYFGWFVGWCGFIIGIAAKKGYELLKGKDSKLKAVIIIIATVLSVVLAQYVTYSILMYIEIMNDPEMASYGLTFIDVAINTLYIIFEDAEFGLAVLKDMLIGLVFAGLGIFSTVKEIFTSNSKKTDKAIKL